MGAISDNLPWVESDIKAGRNVRQIINSHNQYLAYINKQKASLRPLMENEDLECCCNNRVGYICVLVASSGISINPLLRDASLFCTHGQDGNGTKNVESLQFA